MAGGDRSPSVLGGISVDGSKRQTSVLLPLLSRHDDRDIAVEVLRMPSVTVTNDNQIL